MDIERAVDRFRTATAGFARLVEHVDDDAWERPGLGSWSVRSLTGHTARAMQTVLDYLPRVVAVRDVPDSIAYFRAVHGHDDDVRARGERAGRDLGPHPAEAVSALARASTAALERAGDPVIRTAAGGMALSDYLPTRTFELTVHALDLARACDLPFQPAPELLEDAVMLAAGVGARGGAGVMLLGSLTGRRALPPDFTVL